MLHWVTNQLKLPQRASWMLTEGTVKALWSLTVSVFFFSWLFACLIDFFLFWYFSKTSVIFLWNSYQDVAIAKLARRWHSGHGFSDCFEASIQFWHKNFKITVSHRSFLSQYSPCSLLRESKTAKGAKWPLCKPQGQTKVLKAKLVRVV